MKKFYRENTFKNLLNASPIFVLGAASGLPWYVTLPFYAHTVAADPIGKIFAAATDRKIKPDGIEDAVNEDGTLREDINKTPLSYVYDAAQSFVTMVGVVAYAGAISRNLGFEFSITGALGGIIPPLVFLARRSAMTFSKGDKLTVVNGESVIIDAHTAPEASLEKTKEPRPENVNENKVVFSPSRTHRPGKPPGEFFHHTIGPTSSLDRERAKSRLDGMIKSGPARNDKDNGIVLDEQEPDLDEPSFR